MSTASQGSARERKVRDDMVAHGWSFIMRAAASKGSADLLMAHPLHGAALVQVGTGNKTLGPVDRLRFVTDASLCGALPLLASAAYRRGITYWWVSLGPASGWDRWWI